MKRVLKTYQLELEVCGPVYVGSGMEIQKKEYLFLNRNTVGIIDIDKLYMLAKKKHLEIEFEKFMVVDGREDLKHWVERNRISLDEIKCCMKYKINVGDIGKRAHANYEFHARSLWKSIYSWQFNKGNASYNFTCSRYYEKSTVL